MLHPLLSLLCGKVCRMKMCQVIVLPWSKYDEGVRFKIQLCQQLRTSLVHSSHLLASWGLWPQLVRLSRAQQVQCRQHNKAKPLARQVQN